MLYSSTGYFTRCGRKARVSPLDDKVLTVSCLVTSDLGGMHFLGLLRMLVPAGESFLLVVKTQLSASQTSPRTSPHVLEVVHIEHVGRFLLLFLLGEVASLTLCLLRHRGGKAAGDHGVPEFCGAYLVLYQEIRQIA